MLAKESHSYRLDLPLNMKIHPVFPAGNLRRAANDPLPGQHNDPPPPIKVVVDNEWEVQEIVAIKLTRGKLSYKAKWSGTDEDPEFYPASDFKYSPQLIKNFHLANPKLPDPPTNLAL